MVQPGLVTICIASYPVRGGRGGQRNRARRRKLPTAGPSSHPRARSSSPQSQQPRQSLLWAKQPAAARADERTHCQSHSPTSRPLRASQQPGLSSRSQLTLLQPFMMYEQACVGPCDFSSLGVPSVNNSVVRPSPRSAASHPRLHDAQQRALASSPRC